MPAPPVPAAEAARQRAQRQRLRRRITGAIFAVPLFLLACALYLCFGPKPPPPPAPVIASPQEAAQAEQHVNAVAQALTQPQASPAPEPPSPHAAPPAPPAAASAPVQHVRGPQGEDMMTLQLSEADINTYLATNKRVRANLAAEGVHAVSVELNPPDGIVFHADATIKKVRGNAQATATVAPDPKTALHFKITDARFGRLPPPVVTAVANRIASHLVVPPSHPLPLSVRKVEVKGTYLILTGVENAPAPAK